MGTVYQVPVCADCLQKMWQQAAAAGKTEEFKKYTGWWPGRQEPRRLGDRAFPETARIRDDIAMMEKGVCTHGN